MASKVIANQMKIRFGTHLSNTLNQILWSGAEEAAATLGGMAKDILHQLYPDRKTLQEEVKYMMAEQIYVLVKEVLYRLLGVRKEAHGLDFRHDSDSEALTELVDRFRIDVDALIEKLDLAKLMREILTEELNKFLTSEDYLDAARNIAGERLQEQVYKIMEEEAAKIDLSKLEVPAQDKASKKVSR